MEIAALTLAIAPVLFATISPRDTGFLREISWLRQTKQLKTRGLNFSSGRKQYFLQGAVNGKQVEAFPDTGADVSFISPSLVTELGLKRASGSSRSIRLPNNKVVASPGMVELPWAFKGEKAVSIIQCWVFPGCVHDLVIGNSFLRASETLTRFKNRIRSRILTNTRRIQLRLLGDEQQRLLGSLQGHSTLALPDTGSDAMLVSKAYAQKLGLEVDRSAENWLEVEYADGSTGWTCGVVRDVSWAVGENIVQCDFHVLENLCVDVVLSKNYLFDTSAFTEYHDYFIDANSQDLEEVWRFYGIRLLGQTAHGTENGQLEDTTSPNAFGPVAIQSELDKRDRARDNILLLPQEQREAARKAEADRQRQWEELRRAHQLRWQGTTPSPSQASEPHQGLSGGQGTGTNAADPRQRPKLKDRIKLSLPARYLRRGHGTTTGQATPSGVTTRENKGTAGS